MENEQITPTYQDVEFKDLMEQFRSELKEFGKKVLLSKQHKSIVLSDGGDSSLDRPEMIANIILSYRHIEDAIMRLGKAIQAHDGGVSIYDKK